MCVAEYARYSDDPWATVAVVYIYLYVFYPYIYIYIYTFDNSDDVIRHGPYLKYLHNLFPHIYIF